jgi:hypothetical protein
MESKVAKLTQPIQPRVLPILPMLLKELLMQKKINGLLIIMLLTAMQVLAV